MKHLSLIVSFGTALLAFPSLAGELPSTLQPLATTGPIQRSVGLAADPSGCGLRGGGERYEARFNGRGLLYTPALGRGLAHTQTLALSFESIARGGTPLAKAAEPVAPWADGTRVLYERAGGVQERWQLLPEGVELSYVFSAPPAGQGELAVRLALDTSLPLPAQAFPFEAERLSFELPGGGGVTIGGVLGIDATGRTSAGSLRLVDGALELVLPGAFVAAAAYPLTLDPLIGTALNVSAGIFDDSKPDLAYDASSDSFLVVWQRAFSATSSAIRGQRVSMAGSLLGGGIFFSSSGLAENVKVANLSSANQWVAVWQESSPSGADTLYEIQVQGVAAATGALVDSVTLTSFAGTSVTDPDVGGEGPEAAGANADLIVVYDSQGLTGLSTLRALHLWIDPAGQLQVGTGVDVASDNPAIFQYVSRPSLSKASGIYNRLLVTWQRYGLFGANNDVLGRVVKLDGTLDGSSKVIAGSFDDELEADVDGTDTRSIVAWQRVPSSGPAWIQVAAVSFDLATSTLSVGPIVDVTSPSAPFGGASLPAVGYGYGKSWVAYRETNTLLLSSSFRIRGYDSNTCTSCEGPLTLDTVPVGSDQWIAVATAGSGGAYYDDRGMVAWSKEVSGTSDIKGQIIQNNNLAGSALNAGGGCGAGGTQTLSPGPSIGTNWFIFGLANLPAGTPLSIFNLSVPGVPLSCGTCAWNPLQMTRNVVPQSSGGQTAANTVTVIPCDPALIGGQFEVQWTSITPGSSPCSLFPDISLSERRRLVIGN